MFSECIRKWLELKGMKQVSLAEVLHTSASNIGNKMQRNNFKFSELQDISAFLDITVKTLLDVENRTSRELIEMADVLSIPVSKILPESLIDRSAEEYKTIKEILVEIHGSGLVALRYEHLFHTKMELRILESIENERLPVVTLKYTSPETLIAYKVHDALLKEMKGVANNG